MDLGIAGRSAIVCGGSAGLGRGVAQALAADGVNVLLAARSEDRLRQTSDEIGATASGKITWVVADVTTDAGRDAVLAACPQPDILVNNAGGPPPGDFRDWSRDDWLKAIDANMLSAIFLIFLASFLPLAVASMHAVHNLDETNLRAGRNFGLGRLALVRRVILPAAMPQLLVAMRITLGIAWLVVVAAEMIAVNSGLGFLIVDARNAGNRYDLVIAGMLMIGLIGLLLDSGVRRLERIEMRRRGYGA